VSGHSQDHRIVSEGHSKLTDSAVEVDAEVVGEAQCLASAELHEDLRIALMVAKNALEQVDLLFGEARGRQS